MPPKRKAKKTKAVVQQDSGSENEQSSPAKEMSAKQTTDKDTPHLNSENDQTPSRNASAKRAMKEKSFLSEESSIANDEEKVVSPQSDPPNPKNQKVGRKMYEAASTATEESDDEEEMTPEKPKASPLEAPARKGNVQPMPKKANVEENTSKNDGNVQKGGRKAEAAPTESKESDGAEDDEEIAPEKRRTGPARKGNVKPMPKKANMEVQATKSDGKVQKGGRKMPEAVPTESQESDETNDDEEMAPEEPRPGPSKAPARKGNAKPMPKKTNVEASKNDGKAKKVPAKRSPAKPTMKAIKAVKAASKNVEADGTPISKKLRVRPAANVGATGGKKPAESVPSVGKAGRKGITVTSLPVRKRAEANQMPSKTSKPLKVEPIISGHITVTKQIVQSVVFLATNNKVTSLFHLKKHLKEQQLINVDKNQNRIKAVVKEMFKTGEIVAFKKNLNNPSISVQFKLGNKKAILAERRKSLEMAAKKKMQNQKQVKAAANSTVKKGMPQASGELIHTDESDIDDSEYSDSEDVPAKHR